MRIPWPIPLHERVRDTNTREERERFRDMVDDFSFRKSAVNFSPGEISVLIRRQAAQRFFAPFGIRLMKVGGAEPRVVPSKLTIRSVRSWRVDRDDHPEDEIEIGGLSLHRVDKGRLHLGERHEVGERYGIEIEIDALDIELEDIVPVGTHAG